MLKETYKGPYHIETSIMHDDRFGGQIYKCLITGRTSITITGRLLSHATGITDIDPKSLHKITDEVNEARDMSWMEIRKKGDLLFNFHLNDVVNVGSPDIDDFNLHIFTGDFNIKSSIAGIQILCIEHDNYGPEMAWTFLRDQIIFRRGSSNSIEEFNELSQTIASERGLMWSLK